MSIIDKLVPNPCGEDGTCLVKPTCTLVRNLPWKRRELCHIYAKYYKRHDLISNALEAIANIIAWSFVILIAAVITTIFVLGCIRLFQIVKAFIF